MCVLRYLYLIVPQGLMYIASGCDVGKKDRFKILQACFMTYFTAEFFTF